MKTIVERAKKFPPYAGNRRLATQAEVEIALAWARYEITYGQASLALGKKTRQCGTTYVRMAIALAQYIRNIKNELAIN